MIKIIVDNWIRSTVSLLLTSKHLSQFEIEQKTLKSRPTVSRTLSVLVTNNIVQSHYHAPYKTYFIKNKPKIISWIKQTDSRLIDDIGKNMIEMFID